MADYMHSSSGRNHNAMVLLWLLAKPIHVPRPKKWHKPFRGNWWWFRGINCFIWFHRNSIFEPDYSQQLSAFNLLLSRSRQHESLELCLRVRRRFYSLRKLNVQAHPGPKPMHCCLPTSYYRRVCLRSLTEKLRQKNIKINPMRQLNSAMQTEHLNQWN